VEEWVSRRTAHEQARADKSRVRYLVDKRNKEFMANFGLDDESASSSTLMPSLTGTGSLTTALAQQQEEYLLKVGMHTTDRSMEAPFHSVNGQCFPLMASRAALMISFCSVLACAVW
jgi:hypothetical protein